MNKQWILILLLPLMMSSCGIFRKAGPHTPGDRRPDLTTPLSAAHKASANFSYLSYNADIVFVTGDNENSVSANFRIKKDSLIWVSVRKLGFEAARLMLSKDSVWMMDRLNSRYFAGSYLFFTQQFRLDADYDMIEAFLLGNPLTNWSDEPMDVDCSQEGFCTLSFPERYRVGPTGEYQEGSPKTFQVMEISGQNGRLLYQSVAIPDEGRRISATYNGYKSVRTALLPVKNQVVIEFNGRSDAVTITSESFKTEEVLTFPFRIPSQYKPMELKP